MNKTVFLAISGTLLAMPVLADTEVDRSLDADPESIVEIQNVAGGISVRGWSQNRVRVQGTLGDDVEELIFEREDEYILVKVKVPRNHGRDIASYLTVSIPERSSLEVSGVSADIDVERVRGQQSLATVSGDVEVVGVESNIEAASVSGDVEITGNGNAIEAESATVSGDLVLSNLGGSLEFESVSGDVTVDGGTFGRAYMETVNGDLDFAGALAAGGRIEIESVNGTVDVQLDGPVSARIDIETFNGSIRNCFGPKPQRTSKYSPGLELSFTEGDGDGRISIETLNGSVRICNE